MRRVWLGSFSLVLLLHFVGVALLLRAKTEFEQNFGGFEHPLKDELASFFVIQSELPAAEFSQNAPNTRQSDHAAQSSPKTEQPLNPTKNIHSQVKLHQKPKSKEKRAQKEAKTKRATPSKSAPSQNSAATSNASFAPPSLNQNRLASAQTGAGASAKSSWQALVLSHLYRHIQYPPQALARKQEGVVLVKVRIDREGRVLFCKVVKTSGYALLDEEAGALFARSGALPAPPKEFFSQTNELLLNFPIEFNIKKYKQQLKF